MQLEFWPSTGPMSDDGTTCEPSHRQRETGESISSVGASLARISAMLETKRASLDNGVVYGRSTKESFARFNQDLCSWRTSQRCLNGEWEQFSQTWPHSGWMQNGQVYQRAPWVHHIHDSGCSLLPTPRKADGGMKGQRFKFSSLAKAGQRPDGRGKGRLQLLLASMGFILTPRICEWLMSFPIGWTELEPVATPSSPRSPNGSDEG